MLINIIMCLIYIGKNYSVTVKKVFPFFLLSIVCFASCKQPYYFLSPLNSTSQTYHTIPLQSDSIRSAIYANGIVTLGAANQAGRDNVYSFNGNISRSHNLGLFQAYYGIGFTAGDYIIQKYSNTPVTIPPTDNFFEAIGVNGAINLVVPLGHRGSEWRIIGVETSLQNESGSYLQFRKSIVDSASDYNLIEANNWTTTIGGYSEIIFKTNDDIQLGYKIACGESLQNSSNYYGYAVHVNPFYLSNTFHATRKSVTAFAQIYVGTYATGIQLGINYRIHKKKKKF